MVLVAVREHDLPQARGVVQLRERGEDRTFGAERAGVDHCESRVETNCVRIHDLEAQHRDRRCDRYDVEHDCWRP